MTYPGGKAGAGVFQTIINLMPPHDCYIEPFLGGGAVMRLKKPARLNFGVDLHAAAVNAAKNLEIPSPESASGPGETGESGRTRSHHGKSGDTRSLHTRTSDAAEYFIQQRDGLEFLKTYPYTGNELVYCDPPYVRSTRASRGALYAFEMSDEQHKELLRIVKGLPCKVMLSGYWSAMYARALKNWNSVTFEAMTRGGRPATEWLWFNFEKPVELHDYRYLGVNFRERERIKRKKNRWTERLRRMPALEKQALLCAIAETNASPQQSRVERRP